MQLLTAALRRITGRHVKSYLLAALALGLCNAAHAEYQWVGGNSGTLTGGGNDDLWSNPFNWLDTNTSTIGGSVPSTGVQTRVGNNTTDPNAHSTATIDSTVTAATGNLFISDNNANFGTLIMTGGTLAPSGGFAIGGNGNIGGNGTFLMSGGTLTLANNGSMNIGLASSGNGGTTFGTVSLTQNAVVNTGGSATLNIGNRGNGTLIIDNNASINLGTTGGLVLGLTGATGNGTVIMNSGTLVSGGSITMGVNGSTSGWFDLNGGRVSTGTMSVANTNTASGRLTVSGGSLNTTGDLTVSRLAGLGTMIVKGSGRVNVGATLLMTNNTTGVATVLLQNGTLVANLINVGNTTTDQSATFIMSQTNVNLPTELVTPKFTQSASAAHVEWNGGTLTVGTIGFGQQFTTWAGGTLSPGTNNVGGGAGFGTTLFTASNNSFFTQGANHHVHMDVGDAGAKDFIQMNTATTGSGTITLNGTIDVEYIGSNPVLGATYDIMKAAVANGIIDGSTLLSHTPGIEFTKSLFTTTNTNDTLRLTISAIPEPGMMAVAGIGALTLLQRRRRTPRSRRAPKEMLMCSC